MWALVVWARLAITPGRKTGPILVLQEMAPGSSNRITRGM